MNMYFNWFFHIDTLNEHYMFFLNGSNLGN